MKNELFRIRIENLETELATSNASFGHQKRSAESWRNYAVISNIFLIILLLLTNLG
jgi:hypothetical protein